MLREGRGDAVVGRELEDAVLVGANVNLFGREYMPVSKHEKEVKRLNKVIECALSRERILKSRIALYEDDCR